MLSVFLIQKILGSEKPENEDLRELKEPLKNRSNLDKLIPRLKKIVTNPDHSEYSVVWQCLSVCYMILFQHIADIRDLDRNIATASKLMNALSKENSTATAEAFMFFSCSIAELHKQKCRVFELNEASEAADMPVALAIDMNKSLRARHSFRLETLLNRSIEKTTEDMFRAIDLFKEGLELLFNRAPLYVLADSQERLWVTTQAKADLNRAIIDLCERIIRQIPDDIRNAALLRHLSLMYSQRCEDGGLFENIDRSVELMEMAVNIAFDEFMSDNNSYKKNFVDILRQRYHITKSSKDRDFVINIYRSEVRKHLNHESCDR